MKKLWTLLLTLVFAVGLISIAMTTTAYAQSGVVMTVNGTEYEDHAAGWSAAVKSGSKDVAIKLFADWIADSNTGFVCPDGGTKDGALHVNRNSFSLDLNGHTIDRNAPEDAVSSPVFYLESCTFSLEDTSEAKTGKITGGYAEKGGGIYAISSDVYINGGNITGNKASKNGGGIYAEDSVYRFMNLYMNGGCISNNEAENGGGVYLNDGNFDMNGGEISDNDASQGGGVYLYSDTFDLNDGVIARNHAASSGGGVYSYDTFIMNGGVIEENYSGYCGGGAFFEFNKSFEMNGGTFAGNTAQYYGGAISSITDPRRGNTFFELEIRGGTFTGNTAVKGNGGAIFWNESAVYLFDCTITGNSAPNGYGGGLFRNYEGNGSLVLGGTCNITGNTAATDRADNNSNIYSGSPGVMMLLSDEDTPLKADSKIGVSFGNPYINSKFNSYADAIITFGFGSEAADCFVSDDPCYRVAKKAANDGFYNVYLENNPNPSYESGPVFTVETKEGVKKEFYDRTKGWVYVIEQSEITDVKLTLHSDWVARNSNFSYRNGTYYGALYISDDCEHNITIDLNGYTIDRGLTHWSTTGYVFYINTNGSLTIMDSSEEQTGTITGAYCGNNADNLPFSGGAFYVDYGTLYIKGGNITGNISECGGGIYCDDQDDAFVYIQGGKIFGNTATMYGGGIYMENGYLYMEGGEITGNSAENGGGVYWESDNAAYFVGGKIDGNSVNENGSGVYAANYGKIYLGGDININTLYLASKNVDINNACGQDGAPDKPLADGASIGIMAASVEDEISEDGSMFGEGDFRYIHSVLEPYFIRSVYKEDGGDHAHKLYINSWGHADARYPRVKKVNVIATGILEDATLDYDTQTITLTAKNTKKNFFESMSLDLLISCTYDKDTYYLEKMDYVRDLRELQEYKIMSDNGTYVICKVNVVPKDGAWAENQDSVEKAYKMIVKTGSSGKAFTDFGEGWVYAVDQSKIQPTTIVLFDDWIAPDGEFEYSKYTDDGALDIDGLTMNLTIDLNGHTISRNLSSATSDGHVIYMNITGSLTIKDTSEEGTGTITGGNTTGYGGAIYNDYGKLYLKDVTISGNTAEYGGAIYGDDEDDVLVYIQGDTKITGNTATVDGGAIYMENGYLYVDGGEISGNTAAENGGAIYWASRDKLCLTGGKIINNTSYHGAGVYVTDWGDIYLGGNIVIKDNLTTTRIVFYDLFLSDEDVMINHAVGQDSDVPNKPFTEGACVRITTNDKFDYCISGSDSRFYMDSIQYLKASTVFDYVCSTYDENGGNHQYKIYYNSKDGQDKEPQIQTITPKSDIVSQALLDADSREITIIADLKAKELGTLENAKLSSLIDIAFNMEGVQIVNFDSSRDFTKPQKYMVTRSDNVYFLYTVKVEWACFNHVDEDGDYACDYCEEYILTDFAILSYNAQTNETSVFVPEAGKYVLIFADHENGSLNNVNIVAYDFWKGINVIPQEVTRSTLAGGDKIMLWRNILGLYPLCDALTVK